MHTNGRMMFEKYALPMFDLTDTVLEVGPSRGNTTLRDMILSQSYNYADIQNFDIGPGMVPMDGGKIMAEDEQFDIVFAAQVIEHVRAPWLWLTELARVSCYAVIILCPVSYEYHPGKGVDCWRIYADGMRALLDHAGMTVTTCITESLDGAQTDTIGIGIKR